MVFVLVVFLLGFIFVFLWNPVGWFNSGLTGNVVNEVDSSYAQTILQGFAPDVGFSFSSLSGGRINLWDGIRLLIYNPNTDIWFDRTGTQVSLGLPEDFKPIVGYNVPYFSEGGQNHLWSDSGEMYSYNILSENKVYQRRELIDMGSGLPDDFKPIVGYYFSSVSGGRINLWDKYGNVFVYNPNTDLWVNRTGANDGSDGRLPFGFKPVVGYWHVLLGEYGVVSLFDSDGELWNYYIDEKMWKNETGLLENLGLPLGAIPSTGYHDTYENKIVLWYGNDIYTSEDSGSFDLVEKSMREVSLHPCRKDSDCSVGICDMSLKECVECYNIALVLSNGVVEGFSIGCGDGGLCDNNFCVDEDSMEITFKPLIENYIAPKESLFGLTAFKERDNIVILNEAGINFTRGPVAEFVRDEVYEILEDHDNDYMFYTLGSGDNKVEYPKDAVSYEDEVVSAILNYPEVEYWQVGNEPDNYWDYPGYSPKEYVELLSLTYDIIKKQNSKLMVVLGGLGIMWNYNAVEELEDAGAYPYFDIFDVHYYGFLRSGEWTIPASELGSFWGNIDFYDHVKGIDDFMIREGGLKPKIMTEYGFYTNGNIYDGNFISERRQAETLVKKNIMAFSAGFSKVFLFTLSDFSFQNCKDDGENFNAWCSSLLTENNRIKQSFYAQKTLTKFIDMTDFLNKEDYFDPERNAYLEVYSFYSPEKIVIPLWLRDSYGSKKYAGSYIFDFDVDMGDFNENFDEVKMYNMLGEEIAIDYSVSGDIYSFSNIIVTQYPYYIVLTEKKDPYCGDGICGDGETCDYCIDCGYCNSIYNDVKLYLPFDCEDENFYTDYSGSFGDSFVPVNNDLYDTSKITGSPDLISGKLSCALDFSGDLIVRSGSYAMNSAEYKNRVSFGGWFKVDSDMSGEQILIGSGGNYKIVYHPTQGFGVKMYFRDDSIYPSSFFSKTISSGVLSSGDWDHVFIAYDGKNMKLYVNGQETNDVFVGKNAKIGMVYFPSLFIGGNTLNSFGDVSVDEILFYDRALSYSEVGAIYNLKETLCFDDDFDGYNKSGALCGVLDCDDSNGLIGGGNCDLLKEDSEENSENSLRELYCFVTDFFGSSDDC